MIEGKEYIEIVKQFYSFLETIQNNSAKQFLFRRVKSKFPDMQKCGLCVIISVNNMLKYKLLFEKSQSKSFGSKTVEV